MRLIQIECDGDLAAGQIVGCRIDPGYQVVGAGAEIEVGLRTHRLRNVHSEAGGRARSGFGGRLSQIFGPDPKDNRLADSWAGAGGKLAIESQRDGVAGTVLHKTD